MKAKISLNQFVMANLQLCSFPAKAVLLFFYQEIILTRHISNDLGKNKTTTKQPAIYFFIFYLFFFTKE